MHNTPSIHIRIVHLILLILSHKDNAIEYTSRTIYNIVIVHSKTEIPVNTIRYN